MFAARINGCICNEQNFQYRSSVSSINKRATLNTQNSIFSSIKRLFELAKDKIKP